MMIVQMDNTSAPSSRERAKFLYEKNIELENKRRRSAQARVPSDPNAWQQMRENYEAIVLEDHGFSEQNNIEYALWQLHYRRIEELRTHFNAAAKSNTSQSAKVSPQPDRVTKIRLQFKTFLSEATGFYHDLILKVKAKYGLPLGYFSEDSDDRAVLDKDGKKYAAVKRGLISWHRCLIYLGDLARYKGLYGEGDSKNREYSAASSYYLQAALLWPSSGNPHHQLAILASYSGDELVTVYRYFRSLAVDSPFVTARENLIVAFEKNRQSYTQLLGNAKVPIKDSSVPPTSKGRGKRELKAAAKDTNLVVNVNNEKTSDIHDVYKSFCVRFVRLNGILFTRTSLETFDEVLSSVSCEFCDLLSSGPDEELNFGLDTAENALFIVRLISILIYTVYNVKRESEGQSYAEIVQRTVLLQNAFTAVFELMGCMLERIVQLRDPSLSYLLPGILVFMEWLACCPVVASGTDADDKQAAVGMKFWNHCTSFLNKILSFWSMSLDDKEDDMCFNNMSHYEEGETGNRLALWEDFELRGFLPIVAAQNILDFSKKHSFGSNGSKEKNARVKRILAAGKSLVNVVRIDQKTFLYDSRMKKFFIGLEPRISNDDALTFDFGCSKSNELTLCAQPKQAVSTDVLLPCMQPFAEGDEDDEVIVFRPALTEKQNDELSPKWTPSNGVKPLQDLCAGDMEAYDGHISARLDMRQQAAFDPGSQILLSIGSGASKNQLPIQPDTSKWLAKDVLSLANSFKAARFMENGHASERGFHNDSGMSSPPNHAVPVRQPTNVNASGLSYNQTKFLEPVAPTNDVATSGVFSANLAMKTSATLPVGTRKNPVSRPGRHPGPPPGFSHVPSSQLGEPVSGSDRFNENSVIDDYSWLDGFQLPTLRKGYGLGGAVNVTSQAIPQYIHNNSGLTGTASFPFPGKQVTSMQLQTGKQNGWQDYQALDHLRMQKEQELQQQFLNGNHQSNSMSEQYHGNSIWNNHYIV